jgi:hypothetical protein
VIGTRLPFEPELGLLYTTSQSSFVCGRIFAGPVPSTRPFAHVGLFVFGTRQWTETEFDEFLGILRSHHGEFGLPSCSLSYSSSAAGTASQRNRIGEALPVEHETRNAVLTKSAATRVAMKAISLIYRIKKSPLALAGFAPEDVRNAIAWMQTPPGCEERIKQALRLGLASAGYDPSVVIPNYFSD